jgi:hypothetical protein
MPDAQVVVALALLAGAPQARGATGTGAPAPVELRVFRNHVVAAAELVRARDVVQSLLAPVPVAISWVDCDLDVDRCLSAASGTEVIEVLVQPTIKGWRTGVCGEAARSTSNDAAVIVFAPCARAVVDDLRRRSKDPRLLTLRVGDLVGLTIAHELGHVWGLAHRPHGLMMPRFTQDGILDLRSGRTALASDEIALLSRTLPERQGLLAER